MVFSFVTPALLCDGSGTRLWPLSRKWYPKQLVPLVGEEMLFQALAKRLSGACEGVSFRTPVVLTNSDFWFVVTEKLQSIGIDPGAILIEPEGKNTAPAVLAPVSEGQLVTFGITPTHAETDYGYLELSAEPAGDEAPVALSHFVEKNDEATAQS